MNHILKICSTCGALIQQCRCLSCNKETVKDICDKCKKKSLENAGLVALKDLESFCLGRMELDKMRLAYRDVLYLVRQHIHSLGEKSSMGHKGTSSMGVTGIVEEYPKELSKGDTISKGSPLKKWLKELKWEHSWDFKGEDYWYDIYHENKIIVQIEFDVPLDLAKKEIKKVYSGLDFSDKLYLGNLKEALTGQFLYITK